MTFIYECTIVYSTCYATYALYHTCFSYANSIVIITWYVWKRYIAVPKMPDVMLGTATVGTVGLIARLNGVSSTGWPGPAWPETIQRAFRALRRLLGIRDSESERRARFQLLKMPVQVVSTRTRGTDWSLWHRWWLAFKVALWPAAVAALVRDVDQDRRHSKFQQRALECDVTSRLENRRQQLLTNADNIRHECLSNSKTQFWI